MSTTTIPTQATPQSLAAVLKMMELAQQRHTQPRLNGAAAQVVTPNPTDPVLELRVAITTNDYTRLVSFYCAGLGIEPAAIWNNGGGQALILNLGKATLEIFDEAQAETIDQIEAEERVSGPIRFALQVPDLQAALARLLPQGATLVHPPVVTPWGDHIVRDAEPPFYPSDHYPVVAELLLF